jgi:hypothetical protein
LIASLLFLTQALTTPIEVPFRTTEDCIVVDANVNEHPVSLMFDSGFGGTILLSSSIDVGPPSGKMDLRDFVGEFQATTVKLKSLQLGPLALHPDEPQIVQQPSDFTASYGQHVDGILGLGALKNMVTEIDFQKGAFIFYPSSEDISTRKPDNKKTFLEKMLPIGGNAMELPVVTPSGDTMTMALDTGNAFYATSHRDVLERVGVWAANKKPNFLRESGVASGAVDSWTMKMPPLTIFGVPVQSSLWDIIDLPSSDAQGDGTVGFGFLSNFNITFDYARRRVWLENWRTPIENAETGDLGISARYEHRTKRVVVVLVSPGSPAAEAGIKPDDQLLSVAGVDLDHPSYQELRKMLEGSVGSTVAVGVSRDGAFKRYEMIRRALTN